MPEPTPQATNTRVTEVDYIRQQLALVRPALGHVGPPASENVIAAARLAAGSVREIYSLASGTDPFSNLAMSLLAAIVACGAQHEAGADDTDGCRWAMIDLADMLAREVAS